MNRFNDSIQIYSLLIIGFFVAISSVGIAQEDSISNKEFAKNVNKTMYCQPEHGLKDLKVKLQPGILEDGKPIDAREKIGDSHLMYYWKSTKFPYVEVKGLDSLKKEKRKEARRSLLQLKGMVDDFGFFTFFQLPLTSDRLEVVEKKDGNYHARIKLPGKFKEWVMIYDGEFKLTGMRMPSDKDVFDVTLTEKEGMHLVKTVELMFGKAKMEYESVKMGDKSVYLGTKMTFMYDGSPRLTLTMKETELNSGLGDDVFPERSFGSRTLAIETSSISVKDGVPAVSFSPDGKRFAYAAGKKVTVLNTGDNFSEDGSFSLENHVLDIQFSPDGNRIAVLSGRNTVTVVDREKGYEEIASVSPEASGRGEGIVYSPGGNYIAVAQGLTNDSGTLAVFDVKKDYKKVVENSFDKQVLAITFSPDGAYLAAGVGEGTVKMYDLQKQFGEAHSYQHEVGVHSLAFSPDGRYLASGSAVGGKKASLKVVDVKNGFKEVVSSSHEYEVGQVTFSPEGQYLAYQLFGTSVRVLEVTDEFREVAMFEHEKPVTSLAFSPDGRYLTLGGRNGKVIFVNAEEGFKKVDVYVHLDEIRNNAINTLTYSPDGKFLASANEKGENNQLKIMRILTE